MPYPRWQSVAAGAALVVALSTTPNAIAADVPTARVGTTQPATQHTLQTATTGLPIADVCQIKPEGNRLILHSRYISPDDRPRGAATVEINELAGRCSLTVRAATDGTDIPSQFFLYHNTQQPADSMLVRTHLTALGAHGGRGMVITISRHLQTADGWWMITFIQGRSGAGRLPVDDSAEVSLTVMKSGDADGRVVCNAADWKSLRTQYATEVNELLRPVLRDLRQYAVFAVEPVVIWQVFPDEWKPDPRLAARIQAAIPALAAERFADRQAGTSALRAEGVDGALHLSHMDRKGLTLQQRTAIDSLLAGFEFLDEDEASLRATDVDFLLDGLYTSDAAARRVVARHLSALLKHPLDFNADAPESVRDAAIERIRTELAVPISPTAPAITRTK